MKLKIILTALSSLLLICEVSNTRAATADAGGGSFFQDNELTLDFFGFTASRDRNANPNRRWGAGASVDYNFCKYFGVTGETYADAWNRPYLLNALADVRYPLKDWGVTPYAFGGVGRQWTYEAQWLGHIGGGLEYRFMSRYGVFVDVREVFGSRDYNLLRFGIKIAL